MSIFFLNNTFSVSFNFDNFLLKCGNRKKVAVKLESIHRVRKKFKKTNTISISVSFNFDKFLLKCAHRKCNYECQFLQKGEEALKLESIHTVRKNISLFPFPQYEFLFPYYLRFNSFDESRKDFRSFFGGNENKVICL